MILNGVVALILHFSSNSIVLLANYVTAVEHRPIISSKYCLPVPKLPHSAAQSLCDSWATCYYYYHYL